MTDPSALPGVVTSDDLRWEREAADARHNSLEKVRQIAERWTASISGILGVTAVFGLLNLSQALAGAPHSIKIIVAVCVTAAATFSLIGFLCAAAAAQGAPRWSDMLDGALLRQRVEEVAPKAIRNLRLSRTFIVAAASLLLVASSSVALHVAFGANGGDESDFAIVEDDAGQLRCVPVALDADDRLVSEGAVVVGSELHTVVASCPSVTKLP